MVDTDALRHLRSGTEKWNRWRAANSARVLNFRSLDLRAASLAGANLSGIDLAGADFSNANCTETNFAHCNLSSAVFADTNLRGATFHYSDLERASFRNGDVALAWFRGARFVQTTISNVDLGEAMELSAAMHAGPSSVDIETLRLAKGRVPDQFWRGAGLSQSEITFSRLYDRTLTGDQTADILTHLAAERLANPIQVKPVFISYSHLDSDFIDTLDNLFQTHSITAWRDTRELVAGRLDRQIDRAIALNPTVVVVLSENSVESDWVEFEAERARELEITLKRSVLCPISLDDTWRSCGRWSAHLRKQIAKYHVVSFANWQEPGVVSQQFDRLLQGLRKEYWRDSVR